MQIGNRFILVFVLLLLLAGAGFAVDNRMVVTDFHYPDVTTGSTTPVVIGSDNLVVNTAFTGVFSIQLTAHRATGSLDIAHWALYINGTKITDDNTFRRALSLTSDHGSIYYLANYSFAPGQYNITLAHWVENGNIGLSTHDAYVVLIAQAADDGHLLDGSVDRYNFAHASTAYTNPFNISITRTNNENVFAILRQTIQSNGTNTAWYYGTLVDSTPVFGRYLTNSADVGSMHNNFIHASGAGAGNYELYAKNDVANRNTTINGTLAWFGLVDSNLDTIPFAQASNATCTPAASCSIPNAWTKISTATVATNFTTNGSLYAIASLTVGVDLGANRIPLFRINVSGMEGNPHCTTPSIERALKDGTDVGSITLQLICDTNLTGVQNWGVNLYGRASSAGWNLLVYEDSLSVVAVQQLNASLLQAGQNQTGYCRIINSSGSYNLIGNAVGAPFATPKVAGINSACVKIAASNVLFDCLGFNITNNGTPTAAGIVVNGTAGINYTNVTIRNCFGISGYDVGAYLHNSSMNTILNATAYSNTVGFAAYGMDFFILMGNLAANNTNDGFSIRNSVHGMLVNNTAHNNSDGFNFRGNHSRIIGNLASNNTDDGFDFNACINLTFINNTAYGAGDDAFDLAGCNNSWFVGTSAYGSWDGIDLSGCFNNMFINSTAYWNQDEGLEVNMGNGNNFTNLMMHSNFIGIHLDRANDTFISNAMIYNNRYGFYVNYSLPGPAPWINFTARSLLFMNATGGLLNYSNLTITDLVFPGEAYWANWTFQPAPLPGTAISLGEFVNISTVVGAPSIGSITWHWLQSDSVPPYAEAFFRLVMYNSSAGWSYLNETPDTNANTLTTYFLSPSSPYGILQYLVNVSALKLDQTILQATPGGIVEFNITITNNGNITLNVVNVTDVLPTNLTFLSAIPAPANPAPQVYTWTGLGPLAPGANLTILLNATVDPGTTNTSMPIVNVTNYVNVTASSSMGSMIFAEDYENATIYYANISLIKLDLTAQQPSPGGLVEFRLAITNAGNVVLAPVNVTDFLPFGLTYLNANPLPNVSLGPMLIWWDVGPLPPTASAIIYVNATVDPGIVGPGNEIVNLTNSVMATGTPPNGFPAVAFDSVDVTVYYANISVIKLDQTAQQLSPGGIVEFFINITNTGNITLGGINFTDVLQPGLTYSGIGLSAAAACTNSLQQVNCSMVPVLNPGQSFYIYLNATVDPGVVGPGNEIVNLTNWVGTIGFPPNGFPVISFDAQNVTVYYANVSVLKLNQTAGLPSPGGTVMFNITVQNTGNVTLDPVVVEDSLPEGLTYSAAVPGPSSVVGGENITWNNVGPLASGASTTILLYATVDGGVVDAANEIVLLENYVNVTGTPPNGFDVYNEDYENATIYYANITVLKLEQTALQPSPGGIVEFSLNITNTGNVTLDPVEVVDVLPVGLTYDSAIPGPSLVAAQTITWNNVGPLAPGASTVLYLNATVDTGTVGPGNEIVDLANYVNVTGMPPNGNNVSAEDYENVTVYYANVSVLKLDQSPLPPSPGGTVTFNITLQNTGNVTLYNLNVFDVLPAGLSYSSTDTFPIGISGQTLNWTFGSLASGASFSILVNATVDAGVVGPGNEIAYLENFVNVTGTPPNGYKVYNEDYENATVYYANVSVLKTDITAFLPSPGGMVEYQITVTNIGNVTLNPVSVVDTLPGEFTFNATNTFPVNVSGSVINWTIGPVAPGSSVVILMNATVNGGTANGTYVNWVDVTGVPPNGFNVTATDNVTVGVWVPAISVVKTASDYSVFVGDTVTYALNISNTGQINLTVWVRDVLSPKLSYNIGEASPLPDSVVNGTLRWSSSIPVLDRGEFFVIRFNATPILGGSMQNNVMVTGVPPNGFNVTDNAFVTIMAQYADKPDKEPEEPECEVDDDCLNECYYCSTIYEECKLKPDRQCGVDDDCIYAGYTCESCVCTPPDCLVDGDCPAGFTCEAMECEPPECLRDEDCDEGLICGDSYECEEPEEEIPEPEYECTSNEGCGGGEFCSIAPGAPGGFCEPVLGECGYAENHAWVRYECGDEPECPECPGGSICEENECVAITISCPGEAEAGTSVRCTISENGEPCDDCDVEVILPDGTRIEITPEGGRFSVSLDEEGSYRVIGGKGDKEAQTIHIRVSPKAPEPVSEPPVREPYDWCILPGLGLIILGLIAWWVYSHDVIVEMETKEPAVGKSVEFKTMGVMSGKLAKGVGVSVFLDGKKIASGKTNRSGRFHFTPESAGTYKVKAMFRTKATIEL